MVLSGLDTQLAGVPSSVYSTESRDYSLNYDDAAVSMEGKMHSLINSKIACSLMALFCKLFIIDLKAGTQNKCSSSPREKKCHGPNIWNLAENCHEPTMVYQSCSKYWVNLTLGHDFNFHCETRFDSHWLPMSRNIVTCYLKKKITYELPIVFVFCGENVEYIKKQLRCNIEVAQKM